MDCVHQTFERNTWGPRFSFRYIIYHIHHHFGCSDIGDRGLSQMINCIALHLLVLITILDSQSSRCKHHALLLINPGCIAMVASR